MWVSSRQFTGRIVTVTNYKIFYEPVFNYTRDFPYLGGDGVRSPIRPIAPGPRRSCSTRRSGIRRSARHGGEAKHDLQRRFGVEPTSGAEGVLRITDNWLELTVRFIVDTHRIRDAKDAMSRESWPGSQGRHRHRLGDLDIVGLPPINLQSGSRRRGCATGFVGSSDFAGRSELSPGDVAGAGGVLEQPTDSGSTCLGSQSTTSGKKMQNAIAAKNAA